MLEQHAAPPYVRAVSVEAGRGGHCSCGQPPREVLAEVYSLATKYDLVVFNPRGPSVHLPMELMAAHASATFWPSGAIQAFGAGLMAATNAVVVGYLVWLWGGRVEA